MPRCGAAELLGYVPPELHEAPKGWFIDYYARNPATGRVERKRIKCNRLKKKAQRRAWARQVMVEITRKLQEGWTPFDAAQHSSAMVTLGAALDLWDRSKERQLNHSSPYSYTSMTSVFREWARREGLLDQPAMRFTRHHATGYLEYISEERLVGNRTYNNHITYMRMLFAWMVEKGYRTADPFQGFKKRKQPRKSRTYLNQDERAAMVGWIQEHDPNLLLPVMWVYYTLIRPGELRRLKVDAVDLANQLVYLRAQVTKSGDERWSTIPDVMLAYLKAAHFERYSSRSWLVTADMVPGERQIGRNTLNGRWNTMRAALGWDRSKQLYSLRDTGIIDLIRAGVDLLAVRDQAGHKDLATTNEYVKHAFPHGPIEIRAKAVPIRAALAHLKPQESKRPH